MYGIFNECSFLNEGKAYERYNELKKSSNWTKLVSLEKEYKKCKDKYSDEAKSIKKEALELIDILMKEAKTIPKDTYLEALGRDIVNAFKRTIQSTFNPLATSEIIETKFASREWFITLLQDKKETFSK